MLLSIIILLMIGGIAYFHYVTGLFSATLSAIAAVFSAVIAVSYQETVVETLLKGKIADIANGAVTVVLFVISYVILRTLFDRLVPGNVRVPLLVDKIGSALMGLVAGVMAAGVVAFAAQQLPFGPVIGMYARYDVVDRDVQINIPGVNAAQDLSNHDEVKSDTLDPAKANSLLIPADSMVLNLVSHLSDNGSLAGARPLASVHPSWLDELFGDRLGIQVGAKHTAMTNWLGDAKVFRLDNAVPQMDGDLAGLRPTGWHVDPVRKVDPSKVLLVVRLDYTADATDSDSKFRFSMASMPLIANGKWIIPIGTLETGNGTKLYVSRPDDFLAASGAQGIDLVYEVDRSDVFDNPDPKATEAKIKPGVFVQVKRMARVDLSDKPVSGPPPASDKYTVMRKAGLEPAKQPAAAAEGGSKGGQPAVAKGTAPVTITDVKPQATLFSGINVPNNTGGQVQLKSGTASMTDKKFAKLTVNATESIALLRQGDFVTQDLYVPPGKTMVQIVAQAPTGESPDPWEWADKLGSFALVDNKGTKYPPNGGWAKIKQQTTDKMVAQYDAASPVTSIAREDGRPMDVWIVFNVPTGTHITGVQFDGKSVRDADVQVK